MLIPYPFAFLSGAAAFDVAAAARGNDEWARTASHLRTVGLASALVAAVPGIIDYFGTVPEGKPRQTATAHALSNVSALVCFAGAMGGERTRRTLGLQILGTALLSLGGWLGGHLAYHHQIGVTPEARHDSRVRETLTPPASLEERASDEIPIAP
jgi:uncharacterized membrane protein